MSERTLSIIKPDAVERNLIGAIIKMIEEEGLQVVAMKKIKLTKEKARGFYHVHSERPFFDSLTDFMSSGPCVVMILEGENAIERYRKIMGATNPENAEEGTIRKAFAQNIERNSVHGSDAPETAAFETSYFFSQLEITG
jgi:nucleoside-diphosphate kinase